MAFEAEIAAGAQVRSICASDPEQLKQRIAAGLTPACAGILSFGTCAGLAPTLVAGSWIVGHSLWVDDEELPVDGAWSHQLLRALPGALPVGVAGSLSPITDPADKLALARRHRLGALDMESHVAARAAADAGLPFGIARVVLDGLQVRIPDCALAGIQPDGRADALAVARSLIRQPWDLPALLRLAYGAWRARQALVLGRRRMGDALAWPIEQARRAAN